MVWRGRDVIEIEDFSREELEELFNYAREMEKYCRSCVEVCRGRILALAFFEPSTRTRLSFETAMKRLGGDVIGFSGEEGISVAKGENFADTIRMLDAYANAIVVRHWLEGAAKFAAEIAEAPVINAGDGANQHPTQAMLDLYTIWRELGTIDGLVVGVLGDLRYARTVNSLLRALAKFRVKKIYLISHPLLSPRKEVLDYLDAAGVKYELRSSPDEVISELDVLYVTRVQKERFPDPSEYEKVKDSYRVTTKLLERAKDTLIVMHPLPRVTEIEYSVDTSKFARYFRQAAYGVPLRMALLSLILDCRL